MESIIKNRISETIKELNQTCSSEQEAIIFKILKLLQEKNIDVTKLAKEHLSMFINHLLVLFSRLESNEKLEMEYLEVMFAELKKESIAISREIMIIINEVYKDTISESEVFLVTTHVENMLNQ